MSINGVSGLQPQWTVPSTTENAPLKAMVPVANESSWRLLTVRSPHSMSKRGM